MNRLEAAKRHRINILGVNVDDISFRNAVFEVLRLAEAKGRGKVVVTINSEFVMLGRRNPNFAKILNEADLALADGQWIAVSKLILGGKERSRIAGVDILEKLCKEGAKKPITVGFLGGFGGVAESVSKRQSRENPSLKVVFAGAGSPTIGYDLRLIRQINAVGRVDILFIAYGMGQQEFWIERMKKKLNVGVFIGVGGAFDYIAEAKKRAPRLWQYLGFEWLWRLILQPKRIWRMRVLPIIFVLVLGEFLIEKIKDLKKRNFTKI